MTWSFVDSGLIPISFKTTVPVLQIRALISLIKLMSFDSFFGMVLLTLRSGTLACVIISSWHLVDYIVRKFFHL